MGRGGGFSPSARTRAGGAQQAEDRGRKKPETYNDEKRCGPRLPAGPTPGHQHVVDSARDPQLARPGSASGSVAGGGKCLAVGQELSTTRAGSGKVESILGVMAQAGIKLLRSKMGEQIEQRLPLPWITAESIQSWLGTENGFPQVKPHSTDCGTRGTGSR